MTPAARALRPGVFLDRDGVVNRAHVRGGKPFPPMRADEVEITAGMPEACDRVRQAGFAVVVVTNQPDVARGRQSMAVVDTINDVVRRQLDIDALYVCPHDNGDGCECRKPKPGMLCQAAADLSLDLNRSFMVGDRWSDVDAGRAAGCRTVYIDLGYQEQRPVAPDFTVQDPVAALDWILMVTDLEEGGRVRPTSLRH